MNRIEKRVTACRESGRKMLIPFITAGDPDLKITLQTMQSMVKAGADMIELGIPFSDPVADGPVIQRACERALLNTVTTKQVVDIVKEFRKTDQETPIIFMGYMNPIEVMGYSKFTTLISEAGVDAVIAVDMTPEESNEYSKAMNAAGLESIYLITPTTPEERIKRIVSLAGGFVYYVSVRGVTGAAELDLNEISAKIKQIKQHTKLPVGVGFGIRDQKSATEIASVSDAVIIGSAIVRIHENLNQTPEQIPAAVSEFITGIRTALDGM
ncbi:MAG: tryptophan synthase subunit alpha [Gammaproteobacteria bacterium]|nr:MAG: tryptophan synthase subunit alpha [Gammaproteobacteria bacterium]